MAREPIQVDPSTGEILICNATGAILVAAGGGAGECHACPWFADTQTPQRLTLSVNASNTGYIQCPQQQPQGSGAWGITGLDDALSPPNGYHLAVNQGPTDRPSTANCGWTSGEVEANGAVITEYSCYKDYSVTPWVWRCPASDTVAAWPDHAKFWHQSKRARFSVSVAHLAPDQAEIIITAWMYWLYRNDPMYVIEQLYSPFFEHRSVIAEGLLDHTDVDGTYDNQLQGHALEHCHNWWFDLFTGIRITLRAGGPC